MTKNEARLTGQKAPVIVEFLCREQLLWIRSICIMREGHRPCGMGTKKKRLKANQSVETAFLDASMMLFIAQFVIRHSQLPTPDPMDPKTADRTHSQSPETNALRIILTTLSAPNASTRSSKTRTSWTKTDTKVYATVATLKKEWDHLSPCGHTRIMTRIRVRHTTSEGKRIDIPLSTMPKVGRLSSFICIGVLRFSPLGVEEYQKFILIFAKGLLTFGSPSHRVEAQLNSLSKIFEIEAQFQHTPGVIQVSFGNAEMKSSETCLIKSNVGLSLGNIHNVHNIYRAVLHDDMYASEGSYQIRKLLHAPPRYKLPIRFFLSYVTCMLICGIAFGGSLNDMWVAGIMGVITRGMQNIASKSDLSASGSEVFTAALVSFIARGFASFPTQIWCFSAISSASVISLLPGYLIRMPFPYSPSYLY